MCVQNVPFKTREKDRKWALDELIRFADDNGLSVGFAPLCGSNRPLTVRCPMCGIVMDYTNDKYFCLECGIISKRPNKYQTTLDDFCD